MNKTIKEYKVVKYAGMYEKLLYFVSEVNSLIKVGWQPLGGVLYEDRCFYQAMVKYEEEKEIKQKEVKFEIVKANLLNAGGEGGAGWGGDVSRCGYCGSTINNN